MLKFVFFLVWLIPLSASWSLVINSLLILSFCWLLNTHHQFFFYNMGTSLAVDSTGYIMILLSIWITVLVFYASQDVLRKNNFPTLFTATNIILCIALVLAFSSMDYFFFYVSFESSLIPTLALIIGWGYQPERIQAGIYMLFYTLFASLPLLMSFLWLYYQKGTLSMSLMISTCGACPTSVFWYAITIFAFLVKLPMYFFHLWLPKAHVEAPVAGSMILAGVLLKLGGYGLIRILPIFAGINKNTSWLWVTTGVAGGAVVSLMCLRQVDMKSLIAYSSVAHMGLVLSGLMLSNHWGTMGALTVMVGHGLCSSGMFYLANIVYSRTQTRSLLINKGLLSIMPSLGLWWFLLSTSNMAAPPSINLLGEINLLVSVTSWSKSAMLGLALLSFFSAAYTLYLYSSTQHGVFFNSLFSSYTSKTQEFLTLFLHWFPLNVMILKSSCMILI